MPANKKNHLPAKELQEIMNSIFDKSTPAERSKLTFVQIDLGELGVYRAELTNEEKTQFARDIINGLSTRGAKLKNSKGGDLAKNVLARSFYFLKESIDNGTAGAAKRWGNENFSGFERSQNDKDKVKIHDGQTA